MDKYLDLTTITAEFATEESARAFFERVRWPDGAVCPHCGCKNAYKIGRRENARRHARPGLWYCRDCKDQFTVTEGTVMESSHIPLNKWLLAIYLLGASKKGMSAHQLHRQLGVTYRSAWFMCHRVRYAMAMEPIRSKLSGTVEVDETWIGGTHKGQGQGQKRTKQIVATLVKRGGEARSFHIKDVTSKTLRDVVRKNVVSDGTVYTDSYTGYHDLDEDVPTHATVNHAAGEYVRGDVHTNTVEGFFSLLKRGIIGTYHHVSPQHLHRYLSEFDYRYTRRKCNDGERAISTIRDTQGKRLTYKELPAHLRGKKEAETQRHDGEATGGQNP
jgi:transposase-like protein